MLFVKYSYVKIEFLLLLVSHVWLATFKMSSALRIFAWFHSTGKSWKLLKAIFFSLGWEVLNLWSALGTCKVPERLWCGSIGKKKCLLTLFKLLGIFTVEGWESQTGRVSLSVGEKGIQNGGILRWGEEIQTENDNSRKRTVDRYL